LNARPQSKGITFIGFYESKRYFYLYKVQPRQGNRMNVFYRKIRSFSGSRRMKKANFNVKSAKSGADASANFAFFTFHFEICTNPPDKSFHAIALFSY